MVCFDVSCLFVLHSVLYISEMGISELYHVLLSLATLFFKSRDTTGGLAEELRGYRYHVGGER